MKKFLLAFATFLLVFFSLVSSVKANKFSCTWYDPLGPCDVYYPPIPDPGYSCSPGSDPTPICRAITDRDECITTYQECPPPEIPEGLCYTCQISFGGCLLVDPDTYGACPYEGSEEGLKSCETGCSSEGTRTRYTCKRGSCAIEENGEYPDAVSCEAGCGFLPIFAGTCYLPNDHAGIRTAIGCVPIETPEEFIGFFVRWGIGIGAGISFLLIILGAIRLMTSGGNPENVKQGQEIIASAIAGLVLIILSVFIIEAVGLDILKLPGLGN